ncbi:unnamed protein product [Effrenium voratum]|uniref:TM7S3/TM198-like domain-containing protein n=1 Tax=Effrenium voratum TaxID=2562239 RepID=A0AA36JT61_9DINO|nr:unnamed protein product [Effrenium voratum]
MTNEYPGLIWLQLPRGATVQDGSAKACDTVGIVLVSLLCLVSLAVCFFGYRIYKLAFNVFAFLVGFGIEAAVGAAWVSQQGVQSGVTEKIIILVCSILWGVLFLVMASKHRTKIEQLLGYIFGICLGLLITFLVLYLVERPLNEAFGQKHQGWEQFAGITLGVPIALLTGYLCRNQVKHLVMLVTAFVGAAAAWRSGYTLLECGQVESEVLDKHYIHLIIFIGLGLMGFVVQFFSQPRLAK